MPSERNNDKPGLSLPPLTGSTALLAEITVLEVRIRALEADLARLTAERDAMLKSTGTRKSWPCGCVACVCEDEARCWGCGAKSCGNHVGLHPDSAPPTSNDKIGGGK